MPSRLTCPTKSTSPCGNLTIEPICPTGWRRPRKIGATPARSSSSATVTWAPMTCLTRPMRVGSRSDTRTRRSLGQQLSEPSLELALRWRAARQESREVSEVAETTPVVYPAVRRNVRGFYPIGSHATDDRLSRSDGLEGRGHERSVGE